MVEQLLHTEKVGGPSPPAGTKYASLAQLAEQGTLNAWVQGSSPWWGTNDK